MSSNTSKPLDSQALLAYHSAHGSFPNAPPPPPRMPPTKAELAAAQAAQAAATALANHSQVDHKTAAAQPSKPNVTKMDGEYNKCYLALTRVVHGVVDKTNSTLANLIEKYKTLQNMDKFDDKRPLFQLLVEFYDNAFEPKQREHLQSIFSAFQKEKSEASMDAMERSVFNQIKDFFKSIKTSPALATSPLKSTAMKTAAVAATSTSLPNLLPLVEKMMSIILQLNNQPLEAWQKEFFNYLDCLNENAPAVLNAALKQLCDNKQFSETLLEKFIDPKDPTNAECAFNWPSQYEKYIDGFRGLVQRLIGFRAQCAIFLKLMLNQKDAAELATFFENRCEAWSRYGFDLVRECKLEAKDFNELNEAQIALLESYFKSDNPNKHPLYVKITGLVVGARAHLTERESEAAEQRAQQVVRR